MARKKSTKGRKRVKGYLRKVKGRKTKIRVSGYTRKKGRKAAKKK